MLERASLFLLGGGAYAALELAWRGTTHWTMFLTGGVCLCLLQALADRPLPLGPAAAVGAAGVSGLELAVGAVCRRVLHTAVWDYADEWGNLAGLVCPKYTAYWFLLCGWVIFVLRGVECSDTSAATSKSLPRMESSFFQQTPCRRHGRNCPRNAHTRNAIMYTMPK